MGCCISSAQEPNSHPSQKSDTTHHLTILEEETIVKEVVISETPKIPKLPLPDSPQWVKSPIPRSPESSIDPKGSEKEEEIELSLSGLSDFLSFSAIDEAVSTSTATSVTMRREKIEEEEGEEVVGPPVYAWRKKSLSGEFSGERPGRMRLPENRRGLVVPARGNVGPQRRRVPPAPAARRRTNLPGTGGAGDGDRRIVEKSVTRKTGAPGYRSVGGSATSVKSRRVVEEQNDTVSGAVVESLENPLVSLECFIFL